VTTIEDLLAAHPDGLTRAELHQHARGRINPAISERQVASALRTLGARVREASGRLTLVNMPLPAAPAASAPPRPIRVVTFDLESVVRQTSHPPDYAERHVYQIGARRLGHDAAWRRQRPRTFATFVRLPESALTLLDRADRRTRYDAGARDPAASYRAFLDFCDGADYLVAYNGTILDFPLLDKELAALGLAPPAARRVDGLYLALALWPLPPDQHRLRTIIERLAIEVDDGRWHDAEFDARALGLLLRAGTREMANWPPAVRALVATAGRGSDAWEMLHSLLEAAPPTPPPPLTDADVREALLVGLGVSGTHRAVRPSDMTGGLGIPAGAIPSLPDGPRIPRILRRDDGAVDVFALARAAKGRAEPRPAQADMAECLRGWVREGRPALIEAPTGTGKSYAMLAVALDWLDADPKNRVVISTYTKALQQQLADDLQRLGAAIPGLLDASDLVKGQANRLSLRGLALALGDLVVPANRRPRRDGGGFAGDPRFRELALFLALRLFARGTETQNWLAWSVDAVDVPAFFDVYTRERAPLYLLHLSQAKAREFAVGATEPLAAHAATAREAIAARRLIVANHALLFANLESFEGLGSRTLLLVDEAHALEAAATSTLAATVDTPVVEQLVADTAAWLAEQGGGAALARVAVGEIERFLDDESLPRAAARAFDLAGRDPVAGGRPRSVVVASPVEGTLGESTLLTLRGTLGVLAEHVRDAERRLRALPTPGDADGAERLHGLRARFQELDVALATIVADIGVLDRGDRGNRLVWATELRAHAARSLRHYQFRILSSPLELGVEPAYRAFADQFPRAYYISATLRVAGRFDFMRRRLALNIDRVAEVALPSPFDHATQACLVAFGDFPSWTEHAEAATRTVAHQLAGYAHAAIRDAAHGAMVLTTSRSAAADITEQLARARARDGGDYALSAGTLLGTRRAVDNFAALGGVLVGTKGLWQGTDIADPARLRLVWVNKLPFAPFADPLIRTRKALVAREAEAAGREDPDGLALEEYYLPLAALELRQAVGRLIRSREHRGVIVISDRKLAGAPRLRRLYRDIFLGSLDPGLLRADPETGEAAGGNIATMGEGWRRIWDFLATQGVVDPQQHLALTSAEGLAAHVLLPELRTIRAQQLTDEEERAARAAGADAYTGEVLRRARVVAGALKGLGEGEGTLRDKQEEALRHLCADRDLLAILPTGYGKSYVFQLPALVLPGVTVVISPLVSLMTDQALELNRTIGGQVRALVAPMRESNSRTGKVEVMEELTSAGDRHGIKIVYLSPERLCQRNFQDWLREGVALGKVRRIAIDEAHTFVTWGDDFRPSFRRAEQFLQCLRRDHPALRVLALTGTATRAVGAGIRRAIFGLDEDEPDPPTLGIVRASPIRPELALYKRELGAHEGGALGVAGLVENVVDRLDAHAILYCLTVKEATATHNRLEGHLGEAERDRLFLYHGRLPEAQKSGVLNEFRGAPRAGEEGFRPMIVVATSAFGLGVDRPDIRHVFVVSPPTDLAALYQQVGRAGRDHATATGMMLATGRAYRTIRFMTRRALDHAFIERIAVHILGAAPALSTERIATALMREDLAASPPRLTPDEVARGARDQYRVQVERVLAELVAAGVLLDGGDFPEAVTVREGPVAPDTTEMVTLVGAILAAVPTPERAPILELHAALVGRFDDEFEDPGALFTALLHLHALGYLEVSQAVAGQRVLRTHVTRTGTPLPADWGARFARRQRALEREVGDLEAFFRGAGCLNRAFADYFDESALPVGVCGPAMDRRCSACRNKADFSGADDGLYNAFAAYRHRPATARALRGREQQRLEGWILRLLRSQRRGLAARVISAVLQGQDGFRKADGTWRLLWPPLTTHKASGRYVGLRRGELERALAALEASGQICRDAGRWFHADVAPGAAVGARSAGAGHDGHRR